MFKVITCRSNRPEKIWTICNMYYESLKTSSIRKFGSLNPMAMSEFWRKARKLLFLRINSKHIAKAWIISADCWNTMSDYRKSGSLHTRLNGNVRFSWNLRTTSFCACVVQLWLKHWKMLIDYRNILFREIAKSSICHAYWPTVLKFDTQVH